MIGLYAGIEKSSAKDCGADEDLQVGGDRECVKSGRNITVGARGGYLLSSTTFLYVKGGFSSGQIRVSSTNAATPEDDLRFSDNLSGFHIGAGIQTNFSARFYGKVDYVYTDYNGYEVSDYASKASLDFNRHQVTAGLGVRF